MGKCKNNHVAQPPSAVEPSGHPITGKGAGATFSDKL